MKIDLLFTLIEAEETALDGIWLSTAQEDIIEKHPQYFQRCNSKDPGLYKLSEAGRVALQNARAAIVR